MPELSQTVSLAVEDGIAVITIDNAPVNALGLSVRSGIEAGIRAAIRNPDVAAIVIAGAGRTFPAGADIREFGKPPKAPFLPEICQQIEATEKPVIAALHGTALGGGLEVALASHFRIASADARLGLPEVTLGILPGAGGTQRLPRLIGAGAALDIMLSGKPVNAAKALDLGLVDEISEGDLRADAISFARRIKEENRPIARTGGLGDALSDTVRSLDEIDQRRARLQRVARGQLAPFKIADCVRAAVEKPLGEGLEFERKSFLECLGSDQSKGMIHAFFAERQSAKIPGSKAAPARALECLGVVGGGTMGAGIAVAILNAGFSLVMVERDEKTLALGRANVEQVFARDVARGRMRASDKADAMARMQGSTDYADLADCDLAIEAVFEDMAVKKAVFAALDAAMKPGAIIATNTSYLDIDELAASTGRAGDVIGLHFFSPANIMRLLEIVVPSRVTPDVVATAFALAKRLGKTSVRAGVCDGFIGNRMLAVYRRAADYMVEDGASPYEVDAALRDFGYPMGPYQVSDLAGGDIGWATRKRKAATRPSEERYVEIADRICERGWFGQKTGRGYYVYEEGARTGTEDPEVLAIIDAERAKKGIKPRAFTVEEIQNRYLAAMINEGCNILDEGIALGPLDIDVTLVHGYGFPRWRGGPMKYADMVGPGVILGRIREYSREDPMFWRVAPLLEKLVAEGTLFDDLNKMRGT
ncbi:MAG: 3-hydroxyacyl-CoA dehydrogenase NAD-binding domain-containing protein [Paracoccaceae bacterium]